jgi:hypothetical protein
MEFATLAGRDGLPRLIDDPDLASFQMVPSVNARARSRS